MFRNNNPDKGTETIKEIYMDNLITVFKFRNNNPDKGTETELKDSIKETELIRLEIITPIRGRKLDYMFLILMGNRNV